ncbi:DALR anticodon-binding domain-containing protein [Corynebacterium tapiri]|uniref:Arginine--tRNA ligase n=1 Tax=Corynebacterium tapiri TaxID=1448266 RepID=A0A5C4U631_9CORY|nr:DALR anticodon-binding domain-containing protein [Corynebacterium tapiri]TNL99708.1 hypothetical protein FHE74_01310 [Corynebacterium tapiri]
MTPADLADLVHRVAHQVLVAQGIDPSIVPKRVVVTRPRNPAHGDYATNVAMQIASRTGMRSVELAERIASGLNSREEISRAAVAGPGFLNISIAPLAHNALVKQILEAGPAYGEGPEFRDHSYAVCVEVSPADAGGDLRAAQLAVVADTLGRALELAGARVSRKYVISPRGTSEFAESLGELGVPVTSTSGGDVTIEAHQLNHARLTFSGGKNVDTLAQLVQELGIDGARYCFVHAGTGATARTDTRRWSRQSTENPLYWVQFCHARMSWVERTANALGYEGSVVGNQLPAHPCEEELLRVLGDLPEVVASVTRRGEVHRVTRYAEELAQAWESFYASCQVLPKAGQAWDEMWSARVTLTRAARVAMANVLHVIGISAPERM